MINIRLALRRTARKISRGGFTLVELLVVIGIIAILAGVALGPITSGIEKAKESSGLQVTRSINLLMFSAANDNNQTYPYAANSQTIVNQLLNQKYATDPTIFAITGTKYAAPTGGQTTAYSLSSTNVDFDFTSLSGFTGGVTSSASDQLPIVYTTGSSVVFSAGGSATLNSALVPKPPFALNGMAVAYKSNSAVFIKGSLATGTTATVANFISTTFSDTGSSYAQVQPK